MTEPNYDIKSLPDFAALQQLARALWRNGSVRGAAVLVGAGLSKNANRPGHDSPEPPLWWELLREMSERLYPDRREPATSNPLRIAEEFRTYFGQAAMDDFLRTRFPDKSWSPGPLHHKLLSLNWTDVLTTNWDTLLERAADEVTERVYEVVHTEVDIAYASSPRIVKLHGTIGDAEPLIFAEEDYRTYTVEHAAFVNLARQIFLENELCLIGFSGDDPNFLQWAGWVRDHLGASARRIYLVGNLRLERATRKYLEARNIAPIDFSPFLEDYPVDIRHTIAVQIFLDELQKAKPKSGHDWGMTPANKFPLSAAGIDAHIRVSKDPEFAAEILKNTVPIFRSDRDIYPGWLICPFQHRWPIGHTGDDRWLLRKDVIALLEPELRVEALFEILWRRTTALAPIEIPLANAIEELLAGEITEVDPEIRLKFALALMRHARFSRDDGAMEQWGAIIVSLSPRDAHACDEANYQWCLRARDKMDYASLLVLLPKIASSEAIWKLRRAALHSEIGQYSKATQLIKEAVADLERRYRLDRNSLSIKSQLAWAKWIGQAADLWRSPGRVNRSFGQQFRELDIDPEREIERIEERASEIEARFIDESVSIRPAFGAGEYRDETVTSRLQSSEKGVEVLYELDQLIERVGIPLRINHVGICAGAAIAATKVAYQPDLEWYGWLLRGIHSHFDREFERHFSRVAVARMPAQVASSLISAVEASVEFWSQRFKGARAAEEQDDRGCALDQLRLALMTLSRMTVRMSPEQAAALVRSATEMAREPMIDHWWLIEALGEVVKYAMQAIPKVQQEPLVLIILEFPLPSEKGVQQGAPWPQIALEVWEIRALRDLSDKRWDFRVEKLISGASAGQQDRRLAVVQLAYLAIHDALTSDERRAFGKALWSDVESQDNGLPTNTGLHSGLLLRLPVSDGIDVTARLSARLLGANLTDWMQPPAQIGTIEISEKPSNLIALTVAVQNGFSIPFEKLTQIFDEIVSWSPQVINDRKDPIAMSFAGQFNKNFSKSAGIFLSSVVVPKLSVETRTGARAKNLIAFIERTRSWPSLCALPYFLVPSKDLAAEVIFALRTGLLSSDAQHARYAAEAVIVWTKLGREGGAPILPKPLIERLVASIESRRSISLPAMLAAARSLLESGILSQEDIHRLTVTISEIRRESRYEDVELDTMEAVAASLIRAECVRLAVKLKDHVDDDGTLQAWVDDAGTDPLPEVRFSLIDAPGES